jgi:hypothetical protein
VLELFLFTISSFPRQFSIICQVSLYIFLCSDRAHQELPSELHLSRIYLIIPLFQRQIASQYGELSVINGIRKSLANYAASRAAVKCFNCFIYQVQANFHGAHADGEYSFLERARNGSQYIMCPGARSQLWCL